MTHFSNMHIQSPSKNKKYNALNHTKELQDEPLQSVTSLKIQQCELNLKLNKVVNDVVKKNNKEVFVRFYTFL